MCLKCGAIMNWKRRLTMDRLQKGEATLRDILAESRTMLANERTFLAYLRTAFSLAAAGLTFIKFFEGSPYIWIGSFSIVSGIVVAILGIIRYNKNRHIIDGYKNYLE